MSTRKNIRLHFFLVLGICITSTVCNASGPYPTITEIEEHLNDYYQQSDIVAEVEMPDHSEIPLTVGQAREYTVKRVWKGSLGNKTFVRGNVKYRLLFANRVEPNGPLDSTLKHVVTPFQHSRHHLTRLYGEGREPSGPNTELSFSYFTLSWYLFFSLLGLAGLSFVTIVITRIKNISTIT